MGVSIYSIMDGRGSDHALLESIIYSAVCLNGFDKMLKIGSPPYRD
jgi:hypothetical protein